MAASQFTGAGNEEHARRRPGGVCLAGSLHCQPSPRGNHPDGLVRVPARPEGGVYRNLDADFTRYKRLMIEPLTVEFVKGWRKQHREVSGAEVRRIQTETTEEFPQGIYRNPRR